MKTIIGRIGRTALVQSLILRLIRLESEPLLHRNDLASFLRPFPLPPMELHFKINFLLEYCRDKRVAHFGFVDYPFTQESFRTDVFLHGRLKTVAASLIGLDNNAEAVELYSRETGDGNVRVADVYALEQHAAGIKDHEVFLLGEIMEHLDNPGKALKSVHSVIPDDAALVITVPNALCYNVFGCALHGVELVHPDHVAWYSPSTLVSLVKRHGFTPEHLCFYQAGSGEKTVKIYRKYPFMADGIIGIFRKREVESE